MKQIQKYKFKNQKHTYSTRATLVEDGTQKSLSNLHLNIRLDTKRKKNLDFTYFSPRLRKLERANSVCLSLHIRLPKENGQKLHWKTRCLPALIYKPSY